MSNRELISEETRELFLLAARLIVEDWVKYRVVCELMEVSSLNEALQQRYVRIDWTDRSSILPIIPTLEIIYNKTPRTMLNVPRKLDEALAKDGYRMKKGRLVRLQL
jgi:hypothetical protein